MTLRSSRVFLTPYSDDGLEAYEVSTMVNYAPNDGPEVIVGWGKHTMLWDIPPELLQYTMGMQGLGARGQWTFWEYIVRSDCTV